MSAHRFDDPCDLAAEVLALPRPMLLGLDIDGVLAPIVAHASDARLLAGTVDILEAITSSPTVQVAVISGRSLDDIERFAFPGGVIRIGSHGMERDAHRIVLDDAEVHRLRRLHDLARTAADDAGDGAWVEHKPASVVLHVREADQSLGADAVAALAAISDEIDDVYAMHGSGVLELFVRHGDKGTAVSDLRAEMSAATTVFVGDDVTDERAFAVLGPGDVGVKVGEAQTLAGHRLRDPEAVQTFLAAIADGVFVA